MTEKLWPILQFVSRIYIAGRVHFGQFFCLRLLCVLPLYHNSLLSLRYCCDKMTSLASFKNLN